MCSDDPDSRVLSSAVQLFISPSTWGGRVRPLVGCGPVILEVVQARATSHLLTVHQLFQQWVTLPAFEVPWMVLWSQHFFPSLLVLGVGRASRSPPKLPRAPEY